MEPFEIIALIFAIAAVVKPIVVMLVKAEPMLKFAEWAYKQKMLMMTSWSIIALVLLFFLLQNMSIVQIWAASAFGMALFAIFLLQFPNSTIGLAKELLDNKNKSWFGWAIFILIGIWVLIALF